MLKGSLQRCRSASPDPPIPQSAPPTAPFAQGGLSESAYRNWRTADAADAVGRDDLIPPLFCAAPCRGGSYPPARPIAACGRLECHSEAMKWPWNLADYGAPIKCQRPNSPVTLSEVEGSSGRKGKRPDPPRLRMRGVPISVVSRLYPALEQDARLPQSARFHAASRL